MGKYNYVDREFFGESKNAAELITNIVYRRRLLVAPEDLTNISVRCKSAKDNQEELERDLLFLCMKHAVKYGLEIENYSDYSMPRRILEYDAGEYSKEAEQIWSRHQEKKDLKRFEELKSKMQETDSYFGIINLVIYLGAGHYKGRRTLKECLQSPPQEIKGIILEKVNNYDFSLFEVEKENPANYTTEMRQFIEAMQARYDKKKLYQLLQREDFQNLKSTTQRAIAVHLNNKDIIQKVVEEKEEMCKAIRDLKRDWKMEGRQEGRQEGRLEGEQRQLLSLVYKKVKRGKSLFSIAEDLEMEQEEVKPMYETVVRFTPDYDLEKIYIAWKTNGGYSGDSGDRYI